MANFDKRECRDCIGNTICADETLFQGGACKKFALKVEALKPLPLQCQQCDRRSRDCDCKIHCYEFIPIGD